MKFLKASFLSGISVAVKSAGSFVINKLVAVFYGPDGITLLAHFQNFLSIFLTLPTDGINRGLIKHLSDKEVNNHRYRSIFWAALLLNLLTFLVIALVVLVFRSYFTELFSAGLSEGFWLMAIFVAILFHLLNYFFLSVLLSAGKLKAYVWINVLSTVIAVGILVPALYSGATGPVLLAYAFGPPSLFWVAILLSIKVKPVLRLLRDFRPEWKSFKSLWGFVLMAGSVVVFGKTVDFFVRDFVIDRFELFQTGLWQGVAKFSDYYSVAFVTIISTVYYPKVSEIINDKAALSAYVRHVMKVLTPILAVGLLVIYFLREFILELFFDTRFKEGAFLMDYQLLGDFFKMLSYILSFIISAQARTWLFIWSQAASAALYVVLILIATELWGLEGLTIAHAIRFACYLLFTVVVYKGIVFGLK
ncbi:O-antigen translocase [Cytophagaceae bacterium ABcell3]|nr:O-antigen translocase [Cytophagaceae bacterium ABcell3]